jgi:hypothetical protein
MKHAQLLSKDIQCGWFNTPRRRRHLTNSLLDWTALYYRLRQFSSITEDQVQLLLARKVNSLLTLFQDEQYIEHMRNIPMIALTWRLHCLREIVLSGFKLELYAQYEKSFAYWYLCRIISDHLAILDKIEPVMPPGVCLLRLAQNFVAHAPPESMARQDISVFRPFLIALHAMCEGMFVVRILYPTLTSANTKIAQMTIPLMTLPGERLYLNFLKRYKWAFLPEYVNMPEPIPTMPNYDAFIDACNAMLGVILHAPTISHRELK